MSHGELCETAKELANILGTGDDLEQLFAVKKSGEDNIKLMEKRSEEVKRCVQGLAKLAENNSKMCSVRSQENKENSRVISNLEQKKHTKLAGIEELNVALGSLENSMRKIDMESGKLHQEKAGIQHDVGDALPKTKYSFSLYSNITRLRWDYSMEDDKLQGFVTSLRDVRPFSLSVKEHSNHFIANYLWDVIASAKNS